MNVKSDREAHTDDWEVYEALKRVQLLPEIMDEAEMKDNPFSNLDTFVAVGKSFDHDVVGWPDV